MTFLETFLSIEDDNRDFDIMNRKLDIFIESSYRDYLINREEAELKVLTEAANDDDLNHLYQEAEQTFMERMKKTVKKIKDTLKAFIDKIITKIRSLFKSKKTDEVIDKVEKKVKKTPSLKNDKIEIQDTSKEEESILQAIDETDKKIAEIKSKPYACTQKDLDELREINEKCAKKRKAAGAIVVSVSLLTGIALYKNNKKNAEKKIKSVSEDNLDYLNDDQDEFTARVITQATNQKASLIKSYVSVVTRGVTDVFNKIKGKATLKDPKEIEVLDD